MYSTLNASSAVPLNAKIYFAHPYASWERGTNENTNGLIRPYIPKSSNFMHLTKVDILFIENRLNSLPRKCIGFIQPIFKKSLLHLILESERT